MKSSWKRASCFSCPPSDATRVSQVSWPFLDFRPTKLKKTERCSVAQCWNNISCSCKYRVQVYLLLWDQDSPTLEPSGECRVTGALWGVQGNLTLWGVQGNLPLQQSLFSLGLLSPKPAKPIILPLPGSFRNWINSNFSWKIDLFCFLFTIIFFDTWKSVETKTFNLHV